MSPLSQEKETKPWSKPHLCEPCKKVLIEVLKTFRKGVKEFQKIVNKI